MTHIGFIFIVFLLNHVKGSNLTQSCPSIHLCYIFDNSTNRILYNDMLSSVSLLSISVSALIPRSTFSITGYNGSSLVLERVVKKRFQHIRLLYSHHGSSGTTDLGFRSARLKCMAHNQNQPTNLLLLVTDKEHNITGNVSEIGGRNFHLQSNKSAKNREYSAANIYTLASNTNVIHQLEARQDLEYYKQLLLSIAMKICADRYKSLPPLSRKSPFRYESVISISNNGSVDKPIKTTTSNSSIKLADREHDRGEVVRRKSILQSDSLPMAGNLNVGSFHEVQGTFSVSSKRSTIHVGNQQVNEHSVRTRHGRRKQRPPLGRPFYSSVRQIPRFRTSNKRKQNAKVVRYALEFFVYRQIRARHRKAKIASRVIIRPFYRRPCAGNRRWCRVKRWFQRNTARYKIRNYTDLAVCGALRCSARVIVWSNEVMPWKIVKKAINKLAKQDGFRSAFTPKANALPLQQGKKWIVDFAFQRNDKNE